MITLAPIFSSGMVLQRDKEIRIWGTTDHSDVIIVRLNSIVLIEKPVVAGEFSLLLPSQSAVCDAVLEIASDSNKILLEKVDIGEVWLAGGQSNMEFFLKNDADRENMLKAANDAHFRYYDVAKWAFDGEDSEGLKDTTHWNRWMTYSQPDAEYFSAAAAYFALQLRNKYDVPVGIVGCNWGGSSAATWLDEKLLEADDVLRIYVDEYRQGLQTMDMAAYIEEDRARRAMMSAPEIRAQMEDFMKIEVTEAIILQIRESMQNAPMTAEKIGPRHINRPGGLYQMMLCKIARFTCRGVIWYQGETDVQKPELYSRLFSAMVQCWRRDWHDELPFLYVQLAPYRTGIMGDGEGFPLIRAQQDFASREIPNVWMTSIMDVGMEYDIHPKLKRPVGERLALLARGKVYSEDIVCEAPQPTGGYVGYGCLVLQFEHAGGSLEIKDGPLSALEIAVNGEILSEYTVDLDKTEFKITSELFKSDSCIKVNFAKKPYCQVNLYNSAGIPAKPFSWNWH